MEKKRFLLIGLGGCILLRGIHHFLFSFPDWAVRVLGMGMMLLIALLVRASLLEERKKVVEN